MMKTRITLQRALMRFVLVLAGLASASAQSMTIRSGHAGHWYAADRSGEGWVLELRDAGGAWLYWFTYDGQGRQRWLTAAGEIVTDGNGGQRIDFAQLVVTRGARFGAAFDPDDVVREAVGSASFRFDTCDSGQFSYSAYGQSQTFAVQRLARVMGTRCETPHGVTGREVADHAGQSGSWYDPAHNGEGYALHWETPNQAIVTWYSYDTQGNQYWMLGTGQLDSTGRIHFPDVHATRGARFGTVFDPDDVERFAWGTLTFELACDGGSASYQSVLPAFGNGTFDLTRLTRLHEVACPWRRPKLTDLYEFSLVELPVDPGPFEPYIAVQGIADNGTIVARRARESGGGFDALVWASGATDWVELPPPAPQGLQGYVQIVPDAADIFATRYRTAGGGQDQRPVVWRNAEWSLLGSSEMAGLTIRGASTDRRVLAGDLFHQHDAGFTPVIWNEKNGLRILRTEPVWGSPRAASNDGRLVVGVSVRQVNGMPRRPALRWVDDQPPEFLHDNQGHDLSWALFVSADGGLVFGADQVVPDASHPNAGQAWWWRGPGDMGYLGSPDDAVIHYYAPYWVSDGTHDGNLIVGTYANGELASSDAYIWTQHTGIVSVNRLLQDAGIASDWTDRGGVQVTSTGDRILLNGMVGSPGPGQPIVHKAAVLRLQTRDW